MYLTALVVVVVSTSILPQMHANNLSELEPIRKELLAQQLVSVGDYYEATKELFTVRSAHENIWRCLEDGSYGQWTLWGNRIAFRNWAIRPRYLRDVSNFNTNVKILGKPIAFPIAIGPSGTHGDYHEDAEPATAKAAQAMGTIFGLSCTSTATMEEVVASAPDVRKWMQVETYRNQTGELIRKAEKLGFEAVVVTIDSPTYGNIYWSKKQQGSAETSNENEGEVEEPAGTLDPSATWDLVPWIRARTSMKLILKGIMTKEDAAIAAALGVDAIIVSNHGGRHLDSVLPTLEVLPEIVSAVDGRVEVYMDGGVTRGSDAFKAIALGAKMVLLGRAALWGLSIDGQNGVVNVLTILKDEFERTMRLAGHKTVQEISRGSIQPYSFPITKFKI